MRVFFYGGKAQARLNQSILKAQGHSVPFVFDSDPTVTASWECEALHDPAKLEDYARQCDGFLVCIASETRGRLRVEISRRLESLGLEPVSAIHPDTFFGEGVTLGKGLQTYPRAGVHDGTVVGDYCVIGFAAAIDHDCVIGNGVTIMNSAAVIGHCKIEDYATIGINATILPYITVGTGAIVEASATIETDVPADTVVRVRGRH
jgi:sugar O-acyltransferase (sialic acid O-acetyltransferase NeuD family)